MARKRKAKPQGLTATIVGGMLERRARKRQAEHQLHMAHLQHAQEAQRFAALQHVAQLMVPSSAEFERAIGGLLSSVGYYGIQHVGGSGDLGVDLWATDPWGRTVIVQCKRKAVDQRIGSPEMQGFIGMVTVHRAHRGLFVTTSGFTKPAADLAAAHGVEMWDADLLSRMLHQARSVAVQPDGEWWWDGTQWRRRQ